MTLSQIKQLLTRAATPFVGEPDAGVFAGLYLDAHLKKYPRMNPLQEAVNDLNAWKNIMDKAPNTAPKLLVDKESVLVFDFQGLPPSLKMPAIHADLERRAKKNGLAAAGINNSGGIITLGMCADGLAQRDLIGIAMFNGGTQCCVPVGGCKGVLGTNPLCYAVPTAKDPLLLDMSTTEVPFFDVRVAKEKGEPLPAGVAVDSLGQPTTDAAAALGDDGVANLLPMGGGFKGYGIVMLIEILTGSLVQSLMSTHQTSGWNPHEYGCFILAIDIAGFTDIHTFKSSVTKMCDELRSMPPAQGFDSVTIPGDRSMSRVKEALSKGAIPVEDSLMEALLLLAG